MFSTHPHFARVLLEDARAEAELAARRAAFGRKARRLRAEQRASHRDG